jgi:hypothetical protein
MRFSWQSPDKRGVIGIRLLTPSNHDFSAQWERHISIERGSAPRVPLSETVLTNRQKGLSLGLGRCRS